jgi:hypothetical protein
VIITVVFVSVTYFFAVIDLGSCFVVSVTSYDHSSVCSNAPRCVHHSSPLPTNYQYHTINHQPSTLKAKPLQTVHPNNHGVHLKNTPPTMARHTSPPQHSPSIPSPYHIGLPSTIPLSQIQNSNTPQPTTNVNTLLHQEQQPQRYLPTTIHAKSLLNLCWIFRK